MNTSVSRFPRARRVRGPGLRKMILLGVLSAVLALGALAGRSGAHLIRIDGDYLYATEDFESVDGPKTPVGWGGNWGNGFAVEADDLWGTFTHHIGVGYGDPSEDHGFAPYLSSSNDDLKFALVDNEDMVPGRDGTALLLRSGYEDIVTFPDCQILEFSCDVFLADTAPYPKYFDFHAIDFIGTEGRLRYFLSMGEMSQHVAITREMFHGLIGELESVRLESPVACFDNLTIKTWHTPEPGSAALLLIAAATCLLRRRRTRV